MELKVKPKAAPAPLMSAVSGTARLSVDLPKNLKRDLKRLAVDEGRTISEIVNELVDNYVRKQKNRTV